MVACQDISCVAFLLTAIIMYQQVQDPETFPVWHEASTVYVEVIQDGKTTDREIHRTHSRVDKYSESLYNYGHTASL